MTAAELLTLLRELIKNHGTAKEAARLWNITPAYLCDILHGRREPGAKLLTALRLEKVVTYK